MQNKQAHPKERNIKQEIREQLGFLVILEWIFAMLLILQKYGYIM